MHLIIDYLISILLQATGPTRNTEFVAGVNYGNRFIPEDWMFNEENSFYGTKYGEAVSPPKGISRVSLCDVEDQRILTYLDEKIQEDDFKRMQEFGVQVIRVPTGYWNWVDLGRVPPAVPKDVQNRYLNL